MSSENAKKTASAIKACKLCGYDKPNYFNHHLKNKHNMTRENYVALFFGKPSCSHSDCTNDTTFDSYRSKFNKYCSARCRGKAKVKSLHTNKVREKISTSMKAFFQSPEGINQRASISEKKKSLLADKTNHPMYGKKHTEMAKEKNRKSQYKYLRSYGNVRGRGKQYECGYISGFSYRSSWEKSFIKLVAISPSVTLFLGEKIIIPYNYKGKDKVYFPDFFITLDTGKSFLIEVKPRYWVNHLQNQAKFSSARKWCELNNTEFVVLSEGDQWKFILNNNLKLTDYHLELLSYFIREVYKGGRMSELEVENSTSKLKGLLDEAQRYKTQVKSMKENLGSRNIRNLVEQAGECVENFLDNSHPSPNPKTESCSSKMSMVREMLRESAKVIKEVKDTKRRK